MMEDNNVSSFSQLAHLPNLNPNAKLLCRLSLARYRHPGGGKKYFSVMKVLLISKFTMGQIIL